MVYTPPSASAEDAFRAKLHKEREEENKKIEQHAEEAVHTSTADLLSNLHAPLDGDPLKEIIKENHIVNDAGGLDGNPSLKISNVANGIDIEELVRLPDASSFPDLSPPALNVLS